METVTELAQKAYEAFSDAMEGINISPMIMPKWKNLSDPEKEAWKTVIKQLIYVIYQSKQ